MYRKQGSDPKRICFYLNGEQAPLQAIIKIHMFWILTKLSLLLIWNLLGYLNSFSLIANPSLLPLGDIARKIQSLSDLKCND